MADYCIYGSLSDLMSVFRFMINHQLQAGTGPVASPFDSSLTFGPIVFSRGANEIAHRLSVVWVTRDNQAGQLRPMGEAAVSARQIDQLCGCYVWHADIDLPVVPAAFYRLNAHDYPINTDTAGRATLAYVSCNGSENEDESWPTGERNRMWQTLADHHTAQPLALLMHGGDQLYADSIVNAHPELSQWAAAENSKKSTLRFSPEAAAAAQQFLFNRYAWLYTRRPVAQLLAHIPSLMMWDDHDIMDGWGSHPEAMLDSPIGQGLFNICRRMFALFQCGLPADQSGPFTFARHYPGFSIIAPDLRSERRPHQILDTEGWDDLRAAFDEVPNGAQVMLMSSVPLLGPRLSWLERIADWIPGAAKYKDDLRDQWQSRSHRSQWQKTLELIERFAIDKALTVTSLSGEIHLATQASMPFSDGSQLRQLVASGIAHPPPPATFARALGWLASLGEDPIPGQAISIEPLPGKRQIYTAQRNFLLLMQSNAQWKAQWVLEFDGKTPPLRWDANASVDKL